MSLTRRIVFSASVVILVFITLTALALERAFVDSSERALRDKMTSQLYTLLAAANVDADGISLPADELDALLGIPGSGMYAMAGNRAQGILWQSASTLSTHPPAPVWLPPGEQRFEKIHHDDQGYYRFAYGIDWLEDDRSTRLTFSILTDLRAFDEQIRAFRQTLWSWLLAMALLLLLAQGLILKWGLSPLFRVGHELRRIENGQQQHIEQDYPAEISRLTRHINQLLQQEREQKTRYRNALGDLAHSLKTPLAVLQSRLAESDDDDGQQEQLERMNAIVEYQLQRAATAGAATIGNTVPVAQATRRILASLQKVYAEKSPRFDLEITRDTVFRGDEGDLMEVLGNLLDNACKWTGGNITVRAENRTGRLWLLVEDDGPGMNPAIVAHLLERGVRADESVSGHGIGLAIVKSIVETRQGELHIDTPATGGTRIEVIL